MTVLLAVYKDANAAAHRTASVSWPRLPHLTISVVAATVAMCATADTGQMPMKEIATYPYIATPARAAVIRAVLPAIGVGMAPADVVAILGEPDEIRPLYAPSAKTGKIVGYTHWYVIQRLVGHGSANEKRESLVRVSYGLDDRVSAIDAWGL